MTYNIFKLKKMYQKSIISGSVICTLALTLCLPTYLLLKIECVLLTSCKGIIWRYYQTLIVTYIRDVNSFLKLGGTGASCKATSSILPKSGDQMPHLHPPSPYSHWVTNFALTDTYHSLSTLALGWWKLHSLRKLATIFQHRNHTFVSKLTLGYSFSIWFVWFCFLFLIWGCEI